MLRISSPTEPSTNVHDANKHLITAILNTNKLFIPKGNHSSINHTHLPMYIHKLFHHCKHVWKENRSDPQIITLNNNINKQIHEHKTNTWKQHLDKIDHKHNPHSLWGTSSKAIKQKNIYTTEAFASELKQPSLT